MPPLPTPEPQSQALAARYGRANSARRRRASWAAMGLLGLLGLCWVVWVGLDRAEQSTYWANIGFELRSDREVLVTYRVGKDPDTEVVCELRALGPTKAVVGIALIRIGPGSSRVAQRTDSVQTSSQAVTGIVESCR
jgi:Domain of unknown function (DUF4307)